MGHLKKKYGLWLCLIWILTACERYDVGGMFYQKYNVDERFEMGQSALKDAPVSNLSVDGDYSILVAADLHYSSDIQNVKQLRDYYLNGNDLFLFCCGDMTDGSEEQLNTISQYFDSTPSKPVFFAPGNHDILFNHWKLYLSLFKNSTYTFEIHGPNFKDLVIVLETASSTLGKKQLEWLKRQLTFRNAYRKCLIFTHVGASGKNAGFCAMMNTEESQALIKLFATHRVDMMFSGHKHIKEDITIEKVRYISLPALRIGDKKAGFARVNIRETPQVEFIDLP